MKKMLNLLKDYFMEIYCIIRNFIFGIKVKIENTVNLVKERAIFIGKRICIVMLKVYATNYIPRICTVLNICCVYITFITCSSWLIRICWIVKKTCMLLSMWHNLCYVLLLIQV